MFKVYTSDPDGRSVWLTKDEPAIVLRSGKRYLTFTPTNGYDRGHEHSFCEKHVLQIVNLNR